MERSLSEPDHIVHRLYISTHCETLSSRLILPLCLKDEDSIMIGVSERFAYWLLCGLHFTLQRPILFWHETQWVLLSVNFSDCSVIWSSPSHNSTREGRLFSVLSLSIKWFHFFWSERFVNYRLTRLQWMVSFQWLIEVCWNETWVEEYVEEEEERWVGKRRKEFAFLNSSLFPRFAVATSIPASAERLISLLSVTSYHPSFFPPSQSKPKRLTFYWSHFLRKQEVEMRREESRKGNVARETTWIFFTPLWFTMKKMSWTICKNIEWVRINGADNHLVQ